ncbi:hypothetical protein GOP47_0010015 [Adiantum capillus-veneris]|uniref:Uncharacterized protein n=1 Tax=Adiantum capillus-veneris TaxID=13818 RepID=A0A9D4ZHS4_ADICA|nr:hypothetical protein GOP47_0010015 [Adiantum capillus-veneris]
MQVASISKRLLSSWSSGEKRSLQQEKPQGKGGSISLDKNERPPMLCSYVVERLKRTLKCMETVLQAGAAWATGKRTRKRSEKEMTVLQRGRVFARKASV